MQPPPSPPAPTLFFQLVASYLPHASVLCGLLGVAVRWKVLSKRNPRKESGLDGMISAFYTAAAVPVGVFLLGCSFKPELTVFLSDLNLALGAAGIASLYIAYKGLAGD